MSYIIRKLEINDKNYINLLSQLTNAPNISFDRYKEIYYELPDNVFVVEHNKNLIATGTLIIQYKLTRGGCKYGYIEDIVVDNKYRNHGIGKTLVKFLVDYAKGDDCYKVILNCSDNNVCFYEKNGFLKNGNEMVIYF